MTNSPTPSPTPGPKPGARPGPKPGPLPGAGSRPTPSPRPAAAVVRPVKNDPAKWGRVDADGTAYVKTADGEREIGSWQAGTPEEGLAHYGTRFEDLATEVELLEARLTAHPDSANTIKETAAQLRATLPTAAVIGDLDALDKRLATIMEHSEAAGEQAREDRARRREESIARKEALAGEAEELAETSTDWKTAGDRMRDILEEWKTIRGIDRKTDDTLWKRYSRARDSFNRRRGSHFAELDRGRIAARRAKEALVERAEALKNSTDWNETARAFRDLMKEWKAAGRAPREVDDSLWDAFRGAQDHFFNARNSVTAERDKEFEANATAKDELLAEYDSQIDPAKGIDTARAKLRELQEKWEQIGFVPRGQVREYEDKIGAVEKRVSDAEESQWRRTDPEAQARANQFLVKVEEFTAQAEAAEAKGNATKAAKLREQAAQWQEWADTAAKAVEDL
ncbi:DUF349 domain-containing protein [Corynebacterium marinum]|uniref:DNA repair ATPase n=1 Tax=Corynebacterium marinum DSM 44953 TaxID=1224162 RepID=A0A0B6TMA6_9CORY|nr:DUF349 domain-containing protein [Corynebacterium marinum]AJK69083.1 hypothetical protein B840_07425 [Corynebacterium marinum DSM 44953]GGO17788.1 hypothetical protein GCM10010980_15380 [Corynebacterium marinum]